MGGCSVCQRDIFDRLCDTGDMTEPSVPPAPEQPTPEAARDPIGKPRSVGLTILVTIVTFGLWAWIWSYWNGEELKNYRRDGLGGVAYLLFTIFISPVTVTGYLS